MKRSGSLRRQCSAYLPVVLEADYLSLQIFPEEKDPSAFAYSEALGSPSRESRKLKILPH